MNAGPGHGEQPGTYRLGGYHLTLLASEQPFRCVCARCGQVVAEGTVEATRDAWAAHRCGKAAA